jgi:glycosyltransferase involved in cell wall biosynthesis
MRILFTFEYPFDARNYGGGHQIARGLGRALARLGHEVHVVANGSDSAGVAMQDAAVRWHFTGRYDGLLGGARIARETVPLIDALRPDLVCSYTSEAAFVLGAARRRGVPTVVYLAAPELLPFRARRLTTLRLIRYNPVTWLQSLASLRVPRVLTLSEMISRQATERWGVPPERVRTVGAGIDERYGAPLAPPRPAPGVEGPRLLSFGRLMLSQKPADAVAEALALRGRSWREWTVVGGGPDDQRLRRRVAELGLADRVRFLGMRPPAEVLRLVDDHDVVLLPSRSESFFITAYETAARARLLITNDVAEVGQYFRGEPSVTVLPDTTPSGYRRALDEMLGDFAARQAAATTLAERVRGEVDWDAVARRFVEATRDLVRPESAVELVAPEP